MTTTAMQVSQATGRTVRSVKIEDKAVLCRIKRGCFGTSKKVPTSRIEVNADKKRLKVTKKLLESAELKAISEVDQEISSFVKAQSLPSSMEDGLYWIPLISVESVNSGLEQLAVRRSLAVDKMIAALSVLIEQDRTALRDTFNEADYPTPTDIQSQYYMDWYYMALTAPKSLEAVSEELYMTARSKMEQNVKEAAEAVRMVLRAQFKNLVDHLVEKLKPSEDGKKKRIFESATEKIDGFLATFSARNITEDAELASLVQDAKNAVEGISITDLRDNDAVRSMVAVNFTMIKEALDPMIDNAPVRAIMLNESEEE
jgi:hypothetical protein